MDIMMRKQLILDVKKEGKLEDNLFVLFLEVRIQETKGGGGGGQKKESRA